MPRWVWIFYKLVFHFLISSNFSCSEGEASNITVYFPQKSGKDATRTAIKLYIPDGVNGMAKIPKYDSTLDKPSTIMTPNNVGLVQLSSSIVLDDSK